MWFEGLTVRGAVVIIWLLCSALGFILVCLWQWLNRSADMPKLKKAKGYGYRTASGLGGYDYFPDGGERDGCNDSMDVREFHFFAKVKPLRSVKKRNLSHNN